MKKSLLIFLVFIYGCSQTQYEYDFNEKWTIIEVKNENEKLNDNFQKSPLLTNSIYPAIRFRSIDSTVIWPGFEKVSHKYKYSIDKSFSTISFTQIDSINYGNDTLHINLICQRFDIEEDDLLGRLSLISKDNSLKIRMVPTERFVLQGRASKID